MSSKVLVISDTHGVFRPMVASFLVECDLVLHAGDFDDDATLDLIEGYGVQLYAVRGNNDWHMAARLPQVMRFQVEDLNFVMAHDCRDVPRDLAGVDVVVFGHSHRYYNAERDGVLWLNPGSCGRRRFGGDLSFILMKVDGRKLSVEKLTIPRE